VFEYRVMRGILGPEEEEVRLGWKILHKLSSSPNIIRMIK
jgi:hypothetical protein